MKGHVNATRGDGEGTHPGCSQAGRVVRMRWCFGSGKYFSSSCDVFVVLNCRLDSACLCGVVLAAGLDERLRYLDCWGWRPLPLVMQMGVMYSLVAAIDILGIIDPWAASMGARAVMSVVDMVCVYVCVLWYQTTSAVME